MRRLKLMYSELISKLHKYWINELNTYFINRDEELCKFLNLSNGEVHVITGPKGCGKTEFSKALMQALREVESNYNVMYITYEESESEVLTYIHFSNRTFINYLKDIANIVKEIPVLEIIVKGLLNVYELISKIVKEDKVKHSNNIVIIDEFRSIDNKTIQLLEVDANNVKDINNYLSRFGGSFKIIYFTSDATCTKLQLKIGSKINWYIMWYLSRHDIYTLLDNLECSLDYEFIWKLTGGNVREIKELYKNNWNINEWLDSKIRKCVNTIITITNELTITWKESEDKILKQILGRIESYVDNVDKLRITILWDYLLNHNIVMEIDSRFKKLSTIPEEKWIGKYNAWQLPIYYYIFKVISEKGLDLEVSDVLRII